MVINYRFTAREMGREVELQGEKTLESDEQAIEWALKRIQSADMNPSLLIWDLERQSVSGEWELVNEGEVY